jgi:hemolysin activation/secretion protein
VILRLGGGYLKPIWNDWQLRFAGSAQYSADPLVAAEQFSLSGAYAVRGMDERAVTVDSGLLLNSELYTPELAGSVGIPGDLRALGFLDLAKGFNRNTAGSTVRAETFVSSVGAGLRYSFSRNVILRLDLARVMKAGTSATETSGDWRTQLSLVIGT